MDDTEPAVTEPEIKISCWACGSSAYELQPGGIMWVCADCGCHTVRVRRIERDEHCPPEGTSHPLEIPGRANRYHGREEL